MVKHQAIRKEAMELHICRLSEIKMLFTTFLLLALFISGYAQTPDKAKLDQFFNRLAEKNNSMGSLIIAKDGNVLYTRSVGYSQINRT